MKTEKRNLAEGLNAKAQNAQRSNGEFLRKLRKKVPKDFDNTVHHIHEKVFSKTDCLECANCCKSLGPRLIDKDIARLSKFLGIKPSQFTEEYLLLDNDGDYVFKKMPCPFIESDNLCAVYHERPKACREYPHTDRKKFSQLLDLSLKNSSVCPAVFDIILELKEHYSKSG